MDRNCKADKTPFPEAGTEALQTNYPQPVSFTVDEVRYHVIPDRHRKQVAIDGTTDMKVRELAIPPTVCHDDTDYAVTTISPLAFARLSRLRIIQLPDSIEEIGRHAFFQCRRLTSITCLTVVPPPISFSEMIEVNRVMCTVHVPKAAVDSYRAAEVWNEFAIMGDADDYPEF